MYSSTGNRATCRPGFAADVSDAREFGFARRQRADKFPGQADFPARIRFKNYRYFAETAGGFVVHLLDGIQIQRRSVQ